MPKMRVTTSATLLVALGAIQGSMKVDPSDGGPFIEDEMSDLITAQNELVEELSRRGVTFRMKPVVLAAFGKIMMPQPSSVK